MRILALSAIIPAGATFYFFVFWRWFELWPKHRLLTYSMMFGTFAAVGILAQLFGHFVFAIRIEFPVWVHALGWILMGLATVFSLVADRQIGIRVRSFTPFFESAEKIELRTTYAYGIVRHPIYAGGINYQLAVFLVSGYLAVAVAAVILFLGSLWFTRQEERRLMERLTDPAAYERYRARVPALIPRFRRLRRGPP
jgi:protein-S-isoprenylcysteine O-methyltransferase Ste14